MTQATRKPESRVRVLIDAVDKTLQPNERCTYEWKDNGNGTLKIVIKIIT
jgi:hypothetical protein